MRFTPGVSIDTTGTNAISIRGISSSAGAGTTGIYIDDTPIQMRALGFNPDDTLPKTFDLDRVEVLRGPQGTLFGAGSEGGTVRYIMTQPSVTQESTYVRSEASYTQYGQPSGEAGIAHGGPIVDGVLGYRASVWYRYDGGWIDRIDTTTGDIIDEQLPITRIPWRRASRCCISRPTTSRSRRASCIRTSSSMTLSTYWPAYSNPGSGPFNNATPELIPIPDRVLPAGAEDRRWISRTVTFISNSSYYSPQRARTPTRARCTTSRSIQALGWPNALYAGAPATRLRFGLDHADGALLLVSAARRHAASTCRRASPSYATPNTMTNQQRSWTQEFRLQSNDPDAAREVDRGRLLAAGAGAQHRAAERSAASTSCSTALVRR